MTTPAAPPVVPEATPRRGWGRLLLGLALALSVPIIAQLRMVVPVEQTVLFLGAGMAACAIVGWLAGGRIWLVIAWVLLAGWMLSVPFPAAGSFDILSRGWVMVLAGSFGLLCVLSARADFFPRALSATALSFAVAFALLLARNGGFNAITKTVEAEYTRRIESVNRAFEARTQTQEWRSFVQRFPKALAVVEQGERQLPVVANAAMRVFPALLALESLALLALAWAVFYRASRTRIGPPLARLAEFRFNDHMVWGMVAGVTLVVVPALSELRSLGLNLTVFFGALYALRGLGVLAWFLAPARPTPVLLVLATILASPFIGAVSLGLGLADTWIDWRNRARLTN